MFTEAEKQFVKIVSCGYGDHGNYPANLIRFASDHRMKMKDVNLSLTEKDVETASKLIEDAIRNVVDEESSKNIIKLFRGEIKWESLDKPFEFHQWIKEIFKRALGTNEERAEAMKNAIPEEAELYVELRTAFVQAYIIMNSRTYPACVLECVELYPEIAIDTDRLIETVEYLRSVSIEERGEDVIKKIEKKASDPDAESVSVEDVEYLKELFQKYSGHAIMDPNSSMAKYARELEHMLDREDANTRRMIAAIESRIKDSLGEVAQIKVYGRTQLERAVNDGKITIRIVVKCDDGNTKNELGIEYADILVTLCGKENVRFLPKQEGFLPHSYLTGEIEL